MSVTIFRRQIHYRYIYLLCSLMFLLLASPFATGKLLGAALIDLSILLILSTSILSVATRRSQAIPGLLMLLAITSMRIGQRLSESAQFGILYLIMAFVFFLYVTVLMSRDIFTTRQVTLDTLSGAASVYMLMGITFAYAFMLLETLHPGSFNLPPRGSWDDVMQLQRLVNFSFVTLTTLGYGNITPANPRADSLCSAEAIVGQIYITVLVARLVALQIHHSTRDDRDPPD